MRHLAGELGTEYNERLAKAESAQGSDEKPPSADELAPLILEQLVPFFVKHNSDAEAIDLLMEVGKLEELVPHVDKTNCERVVMYLSQVAQ